MATGLSPANVMTSLQKDVSDALQIADIDKPATTQPNDAQVASAIGEPVTPTTPAEPVPEAFVEAEAHTAASSRWRSRVKFRQSSRTLRRLHLTFSRTPKRHDHRRHRGQQGAIDGSPDRAALAADQGVLPSAYLHLLLLLRQADLERAGLAVRLGRRAENSKFIYTALLEYFLTQLKLAMFGAAFISFPIVAGRSHVRGARSLQARARRVPALLVATPFFFLLGSLLVYFIVLPMLVRFSLGMQQTGGDETARSSCCRRSANICR